MATNYILYMNADYAVLFSQNPQPCFRIYSPIFHTNNRTSRTWLGARPDAKAVALSPHHISKKFYAETGPSIIVKKAFVEINDAPNRIRPSFQSTKDSHESKSILCHRYRGHGRFGRFTHVCCVGAATGERTCLLLRPLSHVCGIFGLGLRTNVEETKGIREITSAKKPIHKKGRQALLGGLLKYIPYN